MAFQTHEQNGLVWLTADTLTGVSHGFSTRKGGVSQGPWASLNLRVDHEDDPTAVAENYRRFCALLGTDSARSVLSRQVHEATVRIVTADDCGKGLLRERDYTADALITNERNLPLFVFSADCGLLLLHDPVHQAIGAIHAGWRGCAAGLVEKTVAEMRRVYGSDPADLQVAIGPCIGQCCFETDSDVPEGMLTALGSDAEPYLARHGEKWHVDLAGLNRRWLLRAGVLPEQIDICDLCTACHPDLFWSHRKMGNQRGLQTAAIVLP